MNDLAATKSGYRESRIAVDGRIVERFNAAVAGRPDLMSGRTSLTVYPGMSGMMENAFINVKNRSFSISADVHIPSSGASGVILAQGGRFGGWSLWLQDGRPRFTNNWLGRERCDIVAKGPMPSGDRNIRFEFAYDGGKPGSGGLGRISVDGAYVAEGRITQTQPNIFPPTNVPMSARIWRHR